jgi:F-type H+-transporting ATPase subunit b
MADATHGAGHGAEAASGGMPQLDFSTFPSQIFWLLVSLGVLYYVITKVALPRIAGAIEDRHDAIEDDLDRAAEFKRRAGDAEKAYEAALAAAKAKAQAIAAAARADIQKDLEKAMAKADAEIAARSAEAEKRLAEIRAAAADSVAAVARETALALTDALAPGLADRTAVEAAVDARMRG